MKEYTQVELKLILEKHQKWLNNEKGGEKADLSSANLRSADLSYAISDLRFVSLSCLGSRKGMTTYCFEYDTIWCGCFKGTLEEFEKKVNETHKNNKRYLKEYLGAINYIRSLKEE